jgi:hypothetical protein
MNELMKGLLEAQHIRTPRNRHDYVRRPEVMERNRITQRRFTNIKKINVTHKRIQNHSVDDLMKIVKLTCEQKNIEYNSVKDRYLELMAFLSNDSLEIQSEE